MFMDDVPKRPTKERMHLLKFQFKSAKKFEEFEKELSERFRDYEPYDLSSVEGLYAEIKKTIEKDEDNNTKIKKIHVAIQRIDLIFEKNEKINNIFEVEGIPYDPHFHSKALYEANKFRDLLVMEIKKAEIDEAEKSAFNVEQRNEVPFKKTHDETRGNNEIVSTSISHEPELKDALPVAETHISQQIITKKNLTAKEAAVYINRPIDSSYRMVRRRKIPSIKVDGTYLFPIVMLDAWIEAGMPSNFSWGTNHAEAKEKIKKKYYFEFNASVLEQLANVFVKQGYLITENAKQFANRFQSCYLIDCTPRFGWEKDMRSLLTFILVSDKLELVKMDRQDRQHNKNSGSYDIPLEPFCRNFEVKKKGKSESSISRRKEGVLNTLLEVERRVRADIREKLTLKQTLNLYYSKKTSVNLKDEYKDGVDWTMLKIMHDITSK